MLANHSSTRVRELIGWDLDDNELRPASLQHSSRMDIARAAVSKRCYFEAIDPVVSTVPAQVSSLFTEQALRHDLHCEMKGLDWSLALVDLRHLLAFQRRLIFDPGYPQIATPASSSWPALFSVTFGPPRSTAFSKLVSTPEEIILQSANPNLQLRPAATCSNGFFELYGGSPFFEVAEYRNRWFLRDGYHRAEHLLRHGIHQVPAVLVHARSLAELGAVGPWFFSEQVLFSSHPPYVTDFLFDELTHEYPRPRMLKTLRVTIEESFGAAPTSALPGEQL